MQQGRDAKASLPPRGRQRAVRHDETPRPLLGAEPAPGLPSDATLQSFPKVIFATWPISLMLAVGYTLRFSVFLKPLPDLLDCWTHHLSIRDSTPRFAARVPCHRRRGG